MTPERDVAIILCGCWAIWTERNRRRHAEASRSLAASISWTLDTMHDLAAIAGSKKKRQPKQRAIWRPPEEGVLKINVDAGFSEHLRQGSTGVVVRNNAGALIRGQAIWYEHAHSARTMEALAIRDGIKLAADLGYRKIILESDAQDVVNLLNYAKFDRVDMAAVCHEISDISMSFISFALAYVSREANEAAHKCAKQATEDRRRCIWVNFIPRFLQDCILSDCNSHE